MTDTPNSGTVRVSRERFAAWAERLELADSGFPGSVPFLPELRAILAQPVEQQDEPVGWQFICHDGKWHNGDDRIKDHRANTEAAGYQTRDVYARSANQAVKLPERRPIDHKAGAGLWKAIGFNDALDATAKLNGIEP